MTDLTPERLEDVRRARCIEGLQAVILYIDAQRAFNVGWIGKHLQDGHPVAAERRREIVAEREVWLAALRDASALVEMAKRSAVQHWFPVIVAVAGPKLYVPWLIGVEAWERYAKKYGGDQSAKRIAERGGFGTEEMDEFRPGWREHIRVDATRKGTEE